MGTNNKSLICTDINHILLIFSIISSVDKENPRSCVALIIWLSDVYQLCPLHTLATCGKILWKWKHGLYSSWSSLGQSTGVGSLSLLQGIFLTQELNWGLLHCKWILYQLSYEGTSVIYEKMLWECVNILFSHPNYHWAYYAVSFYLVAMFPLIWSSSAIFIFIWVFYFWSYFVKQLFAIIL